MNYTGKVNAETRKKILAIIHEYNYEPLAAARSLSLQESEAIGVIIPSIGGSFFIDALQGISEVADANNLTTILCHTEENEEKELKSLKMLTKQRVKGIIITPAEDYSTAKSNFQLRQHLTSLGVPVVFMHRTVENLLADGVFFDNYNGTYMATETLINAGHKKIGVITATQSLLIGRERLAGFKGAMNDYNIDINPNYIYEGDSTAQTAYELTKAFIASDNVPDAVLLSNAPTGFGFCKAVFECGLVLGKDICCIGFDYDTALDLLPNNYSYLQINTMNMGTLAMNLLIERVNQPHLPLRQCIIPSKLILKGSERYF